MKARCFALASNLHGIYIGNDKLVFGTNNSFIAKNGTKFYPVTKNSDGSIQCNGTKYSKGDAVKANDDGSITYQGNNYIEFNGISLSHVGSTQTISWGGSSNSSAMFSDINASDLEDKYVIGVAGSGYGGCFVSDIVQIGDSYQTYWANCLINSDVQIGIGIGAYSASLTVQVGGTSSAPNAGTVTSADIYIVDTY